MKAERNDQPNQSFIKTQQIRNNWTKGINLGDGKNCETKLKSENQIKSNKKRKLSPLSK